MERTELCVVQFILKRAIFAFAFNWRDKNIEKIPTGKLHRIPYSLLTNFLCTFQREFSSIHSIAVSKGQVYCLPYMECARGDQYVDN